MNTLTPVIGSTPEYQFEDLTVANGVYSVRSRLQELMRSASEGAGRIAQGVADFSRDASARIHSVMEPTAEAAEHLAESSEHARTSLENAGLIIHNLGAGIGRSIYSFVTGKRL